LNLAAVKEAREMHLVRVQAVREAREMALHLVVAVVEAREAAGEVRGTRLEVTCMVEVV